MKLSRGRLDRVFSLFRGFKWLWIALSMLLSISVLIHFLFWPRSIELFSLSANRPWGAITGAFVHKNWGHLKGNLFVFVSFCMFFVIANMLNSFERKEFSSKVFFFSGFLAGTLIAGPLELWARDFVPKVMGSSGIIYASAGSLFASSLTNFSYFFDEWGEKQNWSIIDHNLKYPLAIILNLTIIIWVIYWVFTTPFLGTGPEIGMVAHGTGFIAGLLVSIITLNLKKVKNFLSRV